MCFFSTIFFLTFIRFFSVLLQILLRRLYTQASCDELLIDDSFIKALCCTRTWHFLPQNSQRTDSNAFMSFKLVYKLGQVCGPRALKKKYPVVQVLTDVAWKHREMQRKKCVWLCVWENLHQTLKNVWRTQAFSFSTQKKKSKRFPECQGKTQFK